MDIEFKDGNKRQYQVEFASIFIMGERRVNENEENF